MQNEKYLELGAAGQSQQTSGEPDYVVPEEAQYTDLPKPETTGNSFGF